MAVRYKLYQNTRKGSKNFNMWYARATMTGVVNLAQLAEQMQANCTVKKSDIMAVLTELVEEMKIALQDSKRVKIDGFGSFKVGIHSTGAESPKDYNVNKNIRSLSIKFQPESHISADHKRTKTFLAGVTVKEADPYKDVHAEDKSSTTPNP